MYKLIFSALICVPLLMSGCDDGVISKVDPRLQEASKLSPMEAYRYLVDIESKHDVGINDVTQKAFDSAKTKYVLKAANDMNSEALHILFSNPTFIAAAEGKADKARNFLARKILNSADASNDSKLILTAGQILDEGNYAIRDTYRAAGYYARAWAMGESTAANAAAKLYLSNNDIQNAYLWSLRCIKECVRDSTISLMNLEKYLSPEAMQQLQQMADDSTIVALDTKV